MDDRVDPVERAAEGVPVANVADDELDALVEIFRAHRARMHLRIEVVERADFRPLGEQPVREMGTDESRAACDQHLHRRA